MLSRAASNTLRKTKMTSIISKMTRGIQYAQRCLMGSFGMQPGNCEGRSRAVGRNVSKQISRVNRIDTHVSYALLRVLRRWSQQRCGGSGCRIERTEYACCSCILRKYAEHISLQMTCRQFWRAQMASDAPPMTRCMGSKRSNAKNV